MRGTNKWVIATLFFVFSLNFYTLQAQLLKHFTVEDGLPSAVVYSVFEDSLGFIWFATNNGVVKYDGYGFTPIDFQSVGASNDVWEIYDDEDGRIWFSSEKKLVYLENNELHTIPFPKSHTFTNIKYHHFDKKQNHIVYFGSRPIKVIKPKGKKPFLQLIKFKDVPYPTEGINYIKEDETGAEWYSMGYVYNTKLYKSENGLLGKPLDSLFRGNEHENYFYGYHYPKRTIDDEYLVFVEKGIYRIDFEKGRYEFLDILPKGTRITDAAIHTDNISKLTTNNGTIYLDKNLKPIPDLAAIKDVKVNVAFEDSNGNIWICTYGNGVYFLQQSHRGIQKIDQDIIGKPTLNIFDQAKDNEGNIWFTNNTSYIWKINADNEAIPYDLSKVLKREGDVIRYIEFDKYGNLYLSSSQFNCLIIANKIVKNGQFNHFPNIKKVGIDYGSTQIDFNSHNCFSIRMHYVKHISPSLKGDVIIGNAGKTATCSAINKNLVNIHLYRTRRNYAGTIWRDHLVVGKNTELLLIPLTVEADTMKLRLVQAIETLFQDQSEHLWIGTKNDCLYRYNGHQLDSIKEIKQFKLRVFNILEQEENFWLSTNKGLARLKVTQNQPLAYDFKLFTKEHGLISAQINEANYKNDHLYLATQKGIDIVSPDKLEKTSSKKPIFFTKLSLNGRDTTIDFADYKHAYLPLNHHVKNLRIGFSCLPYHNSKSVFYEYRTKGVHQQWQTLHSNVLEFDINTLRSGKYALEIRARNINAIISETISFHFQTIPPWWHSWWAYLGYVLCLVISCYYIVQSIISRKKIKAEHQALADLDNAKTNFFTNITHDLRTPLTIISSLVQFEEEKKAGQKSLFLDDMKAHTKAMLHLINQLLDISKLEAGALPIHLETEDLVKFCTNIAKLFAQNAKIKNQTLEFFSNSSAFTTSFDIEKLERILYNILSNAIKYIPEYSEIKLLLKIDPAHKTFNIEVVDNGNGIDQPFIDNIFEKFVPIKNKEADSTGIGLYLAREMARLLGGDITLKSNKSGSNFKISLPIHQTTDGVVLDHLIQKDITKKQQDFLLPSDFQLPNQGHLSQLLLVDDNPNLLQLLSQILAGKYVVVAASNGQEALDIATENVPELIISDIMMPEIDGYELCKRLKGNIKTSHIPIILLSAKNNKIDEIKGLNVGADAYLTKPFKHQQLLETIEKLLLDRKNMRDGYINISSLNKKQIKNTEDKFVLQLKSLIETHINDASLDVNFLCNSLFMSRTQLHNKLKYTTGLSTRKFIRKVRLEKSIVFMEDPSLKISSIAFEVGMQPKYFSKVFHETYGEHPSQYKKRLIKEKFDIKIHKNKGAS